MQFIASFQWSCPTGARILSLLPKIFQVNSSPLPVPWNLYAFHRVTGNFSTVFPSIIVNNLHSFVMKCLQFVVAKKASIRYALTDNSTLHRGSAA